MSQRFLDLDAETRLEIGYDRVFDKYFAQIWKLGDGPIPTDTVGVLDDSLSHIDHLMDILPDLLKRNGTRAITDDEYCELVLFAVGSRDPDDAVLLKFVMDHPELTTVGLSPIEQDHTERDQCGYCGGWYDITPTSVEGACALHNPSSSGPVDGDSADFDE